MRAAVEVRARPEVGGGSNGSVDAGVVSAVRVAAAVIARPIEGGWFWTCAADVDSGLPAELLEGGEHGEEWLGVVCGCRWVVRRRAAVSLDGV